ncbi:hypothetical protein [Mesobacterium pallidum]|jgi:hypothetical protein|nr:hypothetical protein [Mesobacterium pallidum]
MTCLCISYNQPQPWQTDQGRAMVPPDWAMMGVADNARPVINVDACIADAVQALWDAGVWTTGSCCGHGDPASRTVIVDRGDRRKARDVLDRVDKTIRIGAWEMILDGESR